MELLFAALRERAETRSESGGLTAAASNERWWKDPLVLAVVPVCVATALCVLWTRADRLVLDGDEPHYLIMARSVARDGDLKLENDYQEDAVTREIYGPIEPHAYGGDAGWPPYHSPGLGLVHAYPLQYGGTDAVRLAMIVWSALIPIAIFAFIGPVLRDVDRGLLSGALALSLPLSFGAFRVYPDLPAAACLVAIVLSCITWWRSRRDPPLVQWVLVWTLAGIVPWLQSRFLAPWLLLVAAGLAVVVRASPARRWWLLGGLAPAALGVVALLLLNYDLYGRWLGPPRWGELTTSPTRATMIFLGLHFDQSQGLFVQQPLWLAGLAVLLPYLRSHPREGLWLALLYLATIVPPAMQMGRYGGGGTIGRYAWAASFLWIVPLRFLVEEQGRAGERWCRRALVAAVLWLAFIAARWVVEPELLKPAFDERAWARESLVPAPLRYVLPSFYFWDFFSYLRHPPNQVALAGAALLLATGARWLTAFTPHAARLAWLAWLALAGTLLPASSERDGSAADEARIREAALASESRTVRRFEAEHLPPRSAGWRTRVDSQASNGEARSSIMEPPHPRNQPPIVFGPYVSLAAGRYVVTVTIGGPAAAAARVEQLALIRVTAARGRDTLAEHVVTPREIASGGYAPLRLPFTLAGRADEVEVTVTARAPVEFWIDYVEMAPLQR